jgi:outer membrane protein
MKKTQLIVNVVLGIAVVALFILLFWGPTASKSFNYASNDTSKTKIKGADIAYVNFDTLLSQYTYYKDKQAELQEAQKKAELDLNNRSSAFQKSASDFQYKVQKGLITSKEAQELQKQLSAEEQNLYQFRDKLTSELAEKEQVVNRVVYDNLLNFVKEYNKNGQFKYILSHATASNLLYADPAYDITTDVVKGLNSKYEAEKAAKK